MKMADDTNGTAETLLQHDANTTVSSDVEECVSREADQAHEKINSSSSMPLDSANTEVVSRERRESVENEKNCNGPKEPLTSPDPTAADGSSVLDWISECMNEEVKSPSNMEKGDHNTQNSQSETGEGYKSTDDGNKLLEISNINDKALDDVQDTSNLDEDGEQCIPVIKDGDQFLERDEDAYIESSGDNFPQTEIQDGFSEKLVIDSDCKNCSLDPAHNDSTEKMTGIHDPPDLDVNRDSYKNADGVAIDKTSSLSVYSETDKESSQNDLLNGTKAGSIASPKTESEICEKITMDKNVDLMQDILSGTDSCDIIAERTFTSICDSTKNIMFCEQGRNVSLNRKGSSCSFQSDCDEKSCSQDVEVKYKDNFPFLASSNEGQKQFDGVYKGNSARKKTLERFSENNLEGTSESDDWKESCERIVKEDSINGNANCSLYSEIEELSLEKIEEVVTADSSSVLESEKEGVKMADKDIVCDRDNDCVSEGKSCETVCTNPSYDGFVQKISQDKEGANEVVNYADAMLSDTEEEPYVKSDSEATGENKQPATVTKETNLQRISKTHPQKTMSKKKFGSAQEGNSKRKYKKKTASTKKSKLSKKYHIIDSDDTVTEEDDLAVEILYCNYCNYSTPNKQWFLEHKAKHTGDRPFQCKKCDFRSKTRADLQKHQSKHATVATHRCKVEGCSFATKWPRNLSHHMASHSDERPHSCEICSFSFKRKQDLRYHMFRHNDEKPKVCDKCDFCCKTNYELKLHLLKHTDERNYACTHPGCTQKTKTKSDLKKHMIVHLKVREAVCELCGKAFKDKTALKKHKERHDDRRLFACDLCNKHFKTKAAVKLHLRVHEGIKPFKCEICDHSFFNKFNKAQHMKVHGENRPYHCPICPYGARTADHLLAHIGSMHGDTYAYFCELCRKPYKRYQQLRLHYQRMHTKKELEIFKIDPSDTAIFLTGLTFQNESTGQKYDLENLKHEENKFKREKQGGHDVIESDIKMEDNLSDATILPLECNMVMPSTTEPTDQINGEGDYPLTNNEGDDTDEKRDFKATLAMYGGFRLPLAKKGFKFNFEKPGKKPKSWFMDPKLMDRDSAVRYKNYLKRKGIKLPPKVTKHVEIDETEKVLPNQDSSGMADRIPKVSLTRIDGEFKIVGSKSPAHEKNCSEKRNTVAAFSSHLKSFDIKYDTDNIKIKDCYVKMFDIKHFFEECLVEERNLSKLQKTKNASAKSLNIKIKKKSFKTISHQEKGGKRGKKSVEGDLHSTKEKQINKTLYSDPQKNSLEKENHLDEVADVENCMFTKSLKRKNKSKGLDKTPTKKSLSGSKLKKNGDKIKKSKEQVKQGTSGKGKSQKNKQPKKTAKKSKLNIRLPTYLQKSAGRKEYSNMKWCSKDNYNKSARKSSDGNKNSNYQFMSVKQENDLWDNGTSVPCDGIAPSVINRMEITDSQRLELSGAQNNRLNGQSEILNCLLRNTVPDLQMSVSGDKQQASTDSLDKHVRNSFSRSSDCTTVVVNDITSNETVWKHDMTDYCDDSNCLSQAENTSQSSSAHNMTCSSSSHALGISTSASYSLSCDGEVQNSKGSDARDNLEIHVNLVEQDPPRHVIDLDSSSPSSQSVNSPRKRKRKNSSDRIVRNRRKKISLSGENVKTGQSDQSTSVSEMSMPKVPILKQQSVNEPHVSANCQTVSNNSAIDTEQQAISPDMGNDSLYPMYPVFPMYPMHPMYSVRPGVHPLIGVTENRTSKARGRKVKQTMNPMFPIASTVHAMMNAPNTVSTNSLRGIPPNHMRGIPPNHMVNPLMFPRYPLGMSISSMGNTLNERTVESQITMDQSDNHLINPRYPVARDKQTSINAPKSKTKKTQNRKKTSESKGVKQVHSAGQNVNDAEEPLDTMCKTSEESSAPDTVKSEPPMDIAYLQQSYL